MKISLITPAKKLSRNGNRATAVRWARLLRPHGHRVTIGETYDGEPADLLIAIHAWRSADSIVRFRDLHPTRPIVVALAGTDINTFIETEPEVTLRSIELADALIGLHDLVGDLLPRHVRGKLVIVRQSARPLPGPRTPRKRRFDVCIAGHLRDEKDPLRVALAARQLPADSNIRITHLGRAHTPAWAQAAQAEARENPRYTWLGEVPHWRVRQEFAKTRLMVISSNQEGGANIVSEAVVAGVPVLASDISGNVGLLGSDYPGYFPVGDEQALAALLHRAEREGGFLESLERRCQALAPAFTAEREAASLDAVISSFTPER